MPGSNPAQAGLPEGSARYSKLMANSRRDGGHHSLYLADPPGHRHAIQWKARRAGPVRGTPGRRSVQPSGTTGVVVRLV